MRLFRGDRSCHLWPLRGCAWGLWALTRNRWDRCVQFSVAIMRDSVVKVGEFIAPSLCGCRFCKFCMFATESPCYGCILAPPQGERNIVTDLALNARLFPV